MAAGALAGLRVLEVGERVAAPYCGKLLADLGADVLKLESPEGGDSARRRGPFPARSSGAADAGAGPHVELSALFLYLNTSKRSARLDIDSKAGADRLRELALEADVLIEDRAPGTLAALGLGYEELSRLNPGLIMVSITPFGQAGPLRDRRAHPLNLYHAAGFSSAFYVDDSEQPRPPAQGGRELGEYDAGLVAALGALAAVRGRGIDGRGRHVDVSKLRAMMGFERVEIARFANDPNPAAWRPTVGGLMRAKDGYFLVTPLENHQWHGLVRAMGEPEWSRADWCQNEVGRMEHADEIRPRIEAWAAEHTRDEIYHGCQAEGTPAGPVRSVAEVRAWPQAAARDFFVPIDHPDAGRLAYPRAPYRLSKTPWAARPAPRLGQHQLDIEKGARAWLGPVFESKRSLAADEGPRPGAIRSAPLAGIRVADFTWAWAGPHGTLLLAMLGAEVIKVESRTRLDHSRVRSIMAGAMTQGPDSSTVFNDLNLGKRSLTLNLRKPEAREIARRLVAQSDVVVQNMRPGVMDRLGLGYSDLSQVRPDLIMLSSSAVGATGPESGYAGYAPTFASLSGVADLTGYADRPPVPLSGSVDLRVGATSAFAILAALVHRERSGQGQDIDLSSTEVMSSMAGDAFLEYELCGREPRRRGNRDREMAPHGCYRCRGEQQWLSIAVADDSEWRALCDVLQDEALADPRFASAEARRSECEALDARIERWTSRHSVQEAVRRLQEAGVAALPVREATQVAAAEHARPSGLLTRVEHPVLGERLVLGPPFEFEGAAVRGPAPCIGEGNDYVLRELLGLSAGEIDSLAEAGALE